MYLPRGIYEILPYAYVVGGIATCLASYAGRGSVWSNLAFAAGFAGIVGGCVLILRRRSYRDDAARYDRRSLDE
jgi:membrane associated rhomboid family serine protease